MNTALRIIAAILTIGVPLLVLLIHHQGLVTVPYHPLGVSGGFVALGVLVGVLWRSMGACAYITIIGVVLMIGSCVSAMRTEPLGEADPLVPILAIAFGIIPLTLLGAAIGILIGALIEGYLRHPRRGTEGNGNARLPTEVR